MDLDIKCTVTISKEEVLDILAIHISETFPKWRDRHPYGEPLDFCQGGGGLIVTFGDPPLMEEPAAVPLPVNVTETPTPPANTQPANA